MLPLRYFSSASAVFRCNGYFSQFGAASKQEGVAWPQLGSAKNTDRHAWPQPRDGLRVRPHSRGHGVWGQAVCEELLSTRISEMGTFPVV